MEQALIGGRHVGVAVDGGFQVGDGQFVANVDGQDIVVDDAMAGGDGDGDLPAPRVNSSSSPATVHPGGRGTADMMDLVERLFLFFLGLYFWYNLIFPPGTRRAHKPSPSWLVFDLGRQWRRWLPSKLPSRIED